jgi:membrane protein DedA with SNARE-associated domain
MSIAFFMYSYNEFAIAISSKPHSLAARQPELPLEDLIERLTTFVTANAGWAPLVVGLLAFVESLAIISLFVPATMTLVAIGALVAVSGIEFWSVWLAGAVGAVCGDMISYAVGRRYDRAALRIWPLSRYPHLVEHAQRGLGRHGAWWLFAGKFFGPTRTIGPLIAGVSGMPLPLFKAVTFSVAMVWVFVLLAPGALIVTLMAE